MKRVIIAGGGTGGTMLANTLDRRTFDVTVISESLDHMFQPSLLYVAFRHMKPAIVRGERGLLGKHVHLLEARVTAIDLDQRTVTVRDGKQYSYDHVVIATGIRTDPGQIPGLPRINSQFGDYHSTIEQAQKLWANLDAFNGGTIVLGQTSPICKCPPSPIEGILLVDSLLRKRHLREKCKLVFFTPYPRAYPAEGINDIVEPILKERGIEIMTFFDVDAIDPEKRTITSIEGETITYDLPILIPPFAGAEIAYSPARAADANRLVVTDKATLNLAGYDNAFAIGDATNVPTSKAGVAAHLEAKVVVARLSGKDARFDGRTNCPMDLGDGRGTFVIGSYRAPVIRYRPNRLKHAMKIMMAKIYWISLRGILEPIFDLYFRCTSPERGTPKLTKTATPQRGE